MPKKGRLRVRGRGVQGQSWGGKSSGQLGLKL